MRVSVIVAALAAVASARSLSKRQDQVPQCAMTCIMGISHGTCGKTDAACLCNNQTFTQKVADCIKGSCQDDFMKAIKAACDLCSRAGVTLPNTICNPTNA